MSTHQINLLPEDAIATYHKGRRLSVVARLIFGVGILALLTVVFVGSAAAYLYVLADADQSRLRVVEGSEELRRAEELERQITGFSQELVILRDLKVSQYDPSFLVREIVNVLPSDARLQRFQLVFEDEIRPVVVSAVQPAEPLSNAPTLHLQGTAKARRDVLDFQHAIEILPFVQVVEAPISNIIQPLNPSFQFTLTLIPPGSAGKVKIEASENVNEEGSDESTPTAGEEEETQEETTQGDGL